MILSTIKKRLQSNDGFMGRTHALSALAVALLLIVFIPDFLYTHIFQTNHILIIIASLFIWCGFSMCPDFDNTQSTAISTFGSIGRLMSQLMRKSAILVYLATRSKYDDKDPDPHRSFWHTLISAIIIGVILWITTSISYIITLPLLNKDVTIGFLFAILWIYVGIKLSIAGLFGDWLKKIHKRKSTKQKWLFRLFSILFPIFVLIYSPGDLKYTWIVYSASLGYTIHILGDCLTVLGAPLLFPFKKKGKRWWSYRFAKLKAGGDFEQKTLVPMFTIVILLSTLYLTYLKIVNLF